MPIGKFLSKLASTGVGGGSRVGGNKGKNRLYPESDEDIGKRVKEDVAVVKKGMSARIDEADDTKRGAALRRQSSQEAAGRAVSRLGATAGAVAGAGIAGAALGSKTYEASQKKYSESKTENKDSSDRKETKASEPEKKSETKKDMSFSEAFRKAKKDGDDTFEWKGKKYTTEMKDSSPKPSLREGKNENIGDDSRERAKKFNKGGYVAKKGFTGIRGC